MNVAGNILGRPPSPPPLSVTPDIHEQPGEAHNMPEQWLDYNALAAHWQVGPEAARARVRRGRFQRRTNNLGAVEVLLDTDAPIPQPRRKAQDGQTGTATPSDTPNAETPSAATVTALEALQGHIDTLKAELAKAEAIAAERGQEVAAAREQVATLTSQMLRITADLAEARKLEAARQGGGWWRRLTG
jgi:hypothetical protein